MMLKSLASLCTINRLLMMIKQGTEYEFFFKKKEERLTLNNCNALALVRIVNRRKLVVDRLVVDMEGRRRLAVSAGRLASDIAS